MKFVNINWTTIPQVTTDAFENKDISELTNKSNILYQIYGDSPIYGKNVLLYIGITKNSNIRLSQHLEHHFGRVLNLSIRIGDPENFNDSNLEILESILINLHKPSFNKEYLHDIAKEAKNELILILNKGNRGALQLECSNIWWLNESILMEYQKLATTIYKANAAN